MEVLWWLLIIVSFILGFVGVVVPVIPSVLMYWIGFLIYQFLINSEELSWMFWIIAFVLTVIVLISDFIANSYFVKKYGGTKRGEIASIIGVIIGMFVYPPFGIIFVPFFLVLLIEYVGSRNFDQALKASIGSLLAFVSSAVFNVVVYILLIVWFLLDVFVF
jgi:uncharacterized protein YqgC (DUF456 family)